MNDVDSSPAHEFSSGKTTVLDLHGKTITARKNPQNVYTKTREECEEKLHDLITRMNDEREAIKAEMKKSAVA